MTLGKPDSSVLADPLPDVPPKISDPLIQFFAVFMQKSQDLI